MKSRQTLVIVVCIIMLFYLSACRTQTSDENALCWMPYNLRFGMTYDEFSEQLAIHGVDVPVLKPAQSNAGFVTDGIEVDVNDSSVWDFLDSPTMKKLADEEIDLLDESGLGMADIDYNNSKPKLYFSFNQNKELYEFYCFWTSTGIFTSSVMPEIIANYNSKLGTAIGTLEFSGKWDTDEHGVSVAYISQDCRMTLVHHCKTYNLDS